MQKVILLNFTNKNHFLSIVNKAFENREKKLIKKTIKVIKTNKNLSKNKLNDFSSYELIQGLKLVQNLLKILEKSLSHIKAPITLSVIGCVVNGPGEAAMTDVGITGGKKGNNMLYLSGVQTEKVLTSNMIEKIVIEVEKKAFELENSKNDTTKNN